MSNELEAKTEAQAIASLMNIQINTHMDDNFKVTYTAEHVPVPAEDPTPSKPVVTEEAKESEIEILRQNLSDVRKYWDTTTLELERLRATIRNNRTVRPTVQVTDEMAATLAAMVREEWIATDGISNKSARDMLEAVLTVEPELQKEIPQSLLKSYCRILKKEADKSPELREYIESMFSVEQVDTPEYMIHGSVEVTNSLEVPGKAALTDDPAKSMAVEPKTNKFLYTDLEDFKFCTDTEPSDQFVKGWEMAKALEPKKVIYPVEPEIEVGDTVMVTGSTTGHDGEYECTYKAGMVKPKEELTPEDFTESEDNPGVVFYCEFLGDRIIFDWSCDHAYIDYKRFDCTTKEEACDIVNKELGE
ncbi:MAG: hypothetical protein V3R67_08910 [Thermodesulfobacteriota bacterium]